MNKANTTVIGLFVVGAIALIVVVFVVFGSGSLFKKTNNYVVYFSGSVDGLDVGAPVKLKGVKVGSVNEINALYYAKGQFLIQAIIELEEGVVQKGGNFDTSIDQKEAVKEIIARGLRAQLNSSSFVTGKLYVKIDYFPGTEAVYHTNKTGLIEIPSVPSTNELFEETLHSFMKSLKNLDMEGITESVKRMINRLDDFIASPLWEQNLRLVQQNLIITDSLFRKIDKSIEPLTKHAIATSEEARKTLAETERLIVSLNNETKNNGYQFNKTLKELREAIKSLNRLTDYYEEHPNDIIFGK
ncbi:MAG: MCE family protein [Chlorobi bacterium]|nr:MCE family protein [Chlorobiota bacterium]